MVDFTSQEPMAKLGKHTILKHYQKLTNNYPGTIHGKNPKHLHDMRVASRRLRTACKTFNPYLSFPNMKVLIKHTKTITKALGTVRDLDVFLASLNHHTSSLSTCNTSQTHRIINDILQQRSIKQTQLVDFLHSLQYKNAIDCYAEFFEKTSRTTNNHKIIKEEAYSIVHDKLEKVLAKGRVTITETTPKKLHTLRIHCKQLRYVAEFFKPAFKDTLHPFIHTVTEIQDLLGAHHDAFVANKKLVAYKTRSIENDSELQTIINRIISNNNNLQISIQQQFTSAWQLFDTPILQQQVHTLKR